MNRQKQAESAEDSDHGKRRKLETGSTRDREHKRYNAHCTTNKAQLTSGEVGIVTEDFAVLDVDFFIDGRPKLLLQVHVNLT